MILGHQSAAEAGTRRSHPTTRRRPSNAVRPESNRRPVGLGSAWRQLRNLHGHAVAHAARADGQPRDDAHDSGQSDGATDDEQPGHNADAHHIQPTDAGPDAAQSRDFPHAQQPGAVAADDGAGPQPGYAAGADALA